MQCSGCVWFELRSYPLQEGALHDYHVVPGCRHAIGDFLLSRKISSGLTEIDGVGVFWQKTSLS
jgi:hypothetical protein